MPISFPIRSFLPLVSGMMLVAAVVSLLPPRLLKLIVDEVVANRDYRQLVLVGGVWRCLPPWRYCLLSCRPEVWGNGIKHYYENTDGHF